jgi:hypothetical protein
MTVLFVRKSEHDFAYCSRPQTSRQALHGSRPFESVIESGNSVALSTTLALDSRSNRLGAHQSGSARTFQLVERGRMTAIGRS